ncbi:NADPH-dependent reductase BacG [Paraburkholderia aspalathi]|uniref:SDR family oxidoreductase n=1 Tax=Paraburkholderia aspalathi TaxID=1324617 RepID=UPI00190A4146|nr:SDR family oxidoreductase [Paraburkholderia aspalathi]MBK3843195.1 SDR family oxidoreductase [Paraburkholderia aspalathi]CAE6848087.1 NADPH-dependent reductase BacG [Paraburkholderia aspalathi]CAE6857973.1 NADPH-dependent reductase BacG [Paraburkholderia aspalathi]
MDLQISGRRALVFGGSRGMGRACAQQLSMEGVQVTIAARTLSTLQTAAAEIEALSGHYVDVVEADIATEAGRDAALLTCPDPDILVNNGDGPLPGDFREWRREDWIEAIDQMMLGPIEMIRRTLDGMMARKFGRVINIVSRSVKIPQSELGLSNGARSGLVGFVGGLARQTVAHNVTINNLLPGIFATDAQVRHIRNMPEVTDENFQAIWETRQQNTPAKRYGRAEEIGQYCAFLCSANAGYITGQNLLVDGGSYPGTF